MGNFMNKLVRFEYKGCDADGAAAFVTTDYRPLVIGAGVMVATGGVYCLVNVTKNVLIPKIRKSINNHNKNIEIIVESEEES